MEAERRKAMLVALCLGRGQDQSLRRGSKAATCKPPPKVHLFDAPDEELPESIRLPEQDVPVILAAMAARATHLLTGHVRHFGPYFGRKVCGILVLLPGDCFKRRTAKS